jgi:hypothetical protein
MRRLSYSFSQKLKIRGIIFDLDVLIGNAGASSTDQKPSTSSKIMKDESQSEYKDVIVEKSNNLDFSIGPKSKYSKRLANKLGGSSSVASILSGNVAKETDGQILKRVKTTPGLSDTGAKSASRWLLGAQFGDILDYIGGRTMLLGIMSTSPTNSIVMQQLQKQLSEHKFLTSNVSVSDSSLDAELSDISTRMAFQPREIMLISSNDKLLEVARDAGHISCRYRPVNAPAGKFTCDFTATTPIEIQDAIEAMNGIALRNSVFSSRIY